MKISLPRNLLTISFIRSQVSDMELLRKYTNVKRVPCKVNSPFRDNDKNASFSWYEKGNRVYYMDFGTGETGDIYGFLCKIYGIKFKDVLVKIYDDFGLELHDQVNLRSTNSYSGSDVDIKVRVREWNIHDIEWWGKYGIDTRLLDKADIYPITHFWVSTRNYSSLIKADRLAYAYVERKEGKISFKIYQPLSKTKKWTSNTDKTTLGLWRLLPRKGNIVCVASSVKDALTLTVHTGIPAIALTGEGMGLSNTVISELRNRFDRVCIMLDNDKPGIRYAKALALKTGFENIVLPSTDDDDEYCIDDLCFWSQFKDIAEARVCLGAERFTKLMNKLFYGQ